MFGDRLRELREEYQMTQEQLGKLLNVSKQAVYSYEKNESEPTFEALVKIADIFNVSLDYLLCRTKQRENIQLSDKLIVKTLNDRNKKKLLLDMCKSLEHYNLITK